MSMISCDMRYGRSDEQKRALSAGLLRVVSEATGETADNVFFVIREGGHQLRGARATFA
jgi:Tautomerase enzyme.